MNGPRRVPDESYARGEISREEWVRLRASDPTTAPSGLDADEKGRRGSGRAGPRVPRMWIALAGAGLAAILVIWALAAGLGGGPWNTSYGAVDQVSSAQLGGWNSSATHAVVDASNNTLWFPSGPVRLVVYASPPDHDMAFVIQGLVNPTMHLASGSRVTVTVVNMDPDMYHNWALGSNGPPFGYGSMMGSGMMMSTAMLEPASSSGYWCQTSSFTAESGQLWYLCTYPGHAASGMYGSFEVG